LRLLLAASVLVFALAAVGVSDSLATGRPAAHAARHHKKKHHKKWHRHHHSTTPAAPKIPLGGYQCYSTSQVVSGSGAGYYSHFGPLINLFANGTYQDVNSGGMNSANHWNEKGSTINFTSGPLWSDVNHAHDRGTWYPKGVPMPHAASNVPAGPYTLVIRDTVREGGIPPSVEYSASDGSGGASSAPQSFDYCLLKYPA
jgi:hypothetical protein